MDADGGGRKVFDLPENVTDASPIETQYVSPDGKWLAFYTGYAGHPYTEDIQTTFDLTLNLINLNTGEIQVVTSLLSKDYPNNFVKAAQKLNDEFITADDLRNAFLNGINNSLAWSPNGRYLAFAGQMDGLSSDLYLYDVNAKKIQRLSSGDEEIQWIDWSPDGKWIVHSSVYWVGQGMSFDIYAVEANGSSMHYLSTNSLYGGVENWLNSHMFFENDSQNGPGDYGLRLVDVDTGVITRIWDGAYSSYKIDERGEELTVSAMSPDVSPYLYSGDNPDFWPGPYLINLKTLKKTKIEFSPDLDLNKVDSYVSPNLMYWAAIVNNVITIYSFDNTPVVSVSISPSDVMNRDLVWRPDSSGFFLVDDSNIYSIDVPSGEIRNIETQLINNLFDVSYLWVGNF
jgi:hypothetical protein